MSIRYFETVEELERKVAAGTATYAEKQMAERLGVPVSSRIAYKDRGSTYRSFKAADVDTGKLTRLINSLKGMGIDLTGFINSNTPEQQMDGLVQAISDWLQPAAQGSAGAGTGGAGASSSIKPTGGPAAGPNPRPNPAAQKSYNDPYLESAQMLTRGFFRPGPNRTPTR